MNKKITPDYHLSDDQLVAIRILETCRRWPRHDYRVCVAVVRPQKHERVQTLPDGRVEIMFRKSELKKLIEAFVVCDPDFGVIFTKPMTDKPEARRSFWRGVIRDRLGKRPNRGRRWLR